MTSYYGRLQAVADDGGYLSFGTTLASLTPGNQLNKVVEFKATSNTLDLKGVDGAAVGLTELRSLAGAAGGMALDFSAATTTNTNSITLPANKASGLVIKDSAANNYLNFDTTTGS